MKSPSNPKERNLIKGAIRRVFSRSELRKQALELSRIDYTNPDRPRVTKWSRCTICKEPTPTYQIEIDHVVPLVPLDKKLEEMSWDEVVDRAWCDILNLKPVCKPCHKAKSKLENAERRRIAKGRK